MTIPRAEVGVGSARGTPASGVAVAAGGSVLVGADVAGIVGALVAVGAGDGFIVGASGAVAVAGGIVAVAPGSGVKVALA